MKYTVFTPTYNRRKLLERLYEYLVSENYSDMEWIVIDDGSNDETRIFMEKIVDGHNFEIKYIFQENAGKYMAFNRAIEEAQGDYFICIDSDDLYIKGAFNKLDKLIYMLRDNHAGICFLAADINNEMKIIGDKFPEKLPEANLIDIVCKYHIYGDKGILHRTKILKNYRFPIIPEEKFMTETVLYAQVSQSYKYLLINEVYELVDYQQNGLSSKYRKLMNINPQGAYVNYSLIDKFELKGIVLIKNTVGLLSTTFSLKKGWMKNLQICRHKMCYVLFTPIAYVYYVLFVRRELNKNKD